MNEQQFIAAMQRVFRDLPGPRAEEILNAYHAHFEEARQQGKADEETARALGDPRTIARSFLADFHIQQIEQPPAGQKVHTVLNHLLRAVVLICTILIFNFVFMLWPIVLMALVLLALWAVVIVIVGLSGLFALALATGAVKALLITSLQAKLTLIFYSLGAMSSGILMLGLLYFLSRVFLLSMLRYIQANIKMIKPRS